jgi:hypothetical protein
MKESVKTASGVSISSIIGDSSLDCVLLVFDKPVRTIELTKGESALVASLLTGRTDLETTTKRKSKKQIKVPPSDADTSGRTGR